MPLHDFKSQRLFVDMPLSAGNSLTLSKEQSHYLINVLRMQAGDRLYVFNGKVGEWLACIESAHKKATILDIIEQNRPQPKPADLTYIFAPLKQARLDYMVQKAVEMGVSRLAPVLTQHTQVHKLNLDRLRANVIEAAEQCGVLHVPEVNEPVKLPVLLETWDASRQILFCDEAAESINPLHTLQSMQEGPKAVLIGPEGGFSEQERDMLLGLDYVTPIGLGPRILRADTAAVAALTIVQSIMGDWKN
jgi:16S rRNA (uracil1498-N3)-methyltransferase